MCICMCICMYVSVMACVRVCMHVCECVHGWMRVYMCMCCFLDMHMSAFVHLL